jgi:hypothetical protein
MDSISHGLHNLLFKLGIKSATPFMDITFFGTGLQINNQPVISGLSLGLHHVSFKSGLYINGIKIK